MSVFKVYKGDQTKFGDLEAEFEGNQILAMTFNDLYPDDNFEDDAERRMFFEELLFSVIEGTKYDKCSVSYDDGGTEYLVKAERKKSGKIKLTYTKGAATKKLQVIAVQDEFKDKKVHMVIPPNKVPLDSQYLKDAVGQFTNAAHTDDDAKARFLLGMLLLKKCR